MVIMLKHFLLLKNYLTFDKNTALFNEVIVPAPDNNNRSGKIMPEELIEIAALLGEQDDFDEMIRLLISKACALFKAQNAAILIINPQTQHTIKTVVQENQKNAHKHYHILNTNVTGWMMKNKQPFLSPDIGKDKRFQKDLFANISISSVMGVQFKSLGNITGFFIIMNKTADFPYSRDDLNWLIKLSHLTAPFISNLQKIQEFFSIPLSDNALQKKYRHNGLIGHSKTFIELLKAIDAASRCDARVLLEGESGTGKELVARSIHISSARRDGPFIAMDCGAIPENLIESELFGHVKGAFTGAINDHKGLFLQAHGGTLFMDEISNLPLEMQAKLLRVLQENEIRPLGSSHSQKINIRIIAASSATLAKLVDNKQFREDLFYRLYVYPIYIPTLNERSEDIPGLALHFMKKFAAQQNKCYSKVQKSLLNFMKQRKWKGNIRELENLMERLVILAPPEITELKPDILPPDIKKEFNKMYSNDREFIVSKSLNEFLNEYEEKIIRKALKAADWNQSKAARMLKVSEQTIRYKMAKYGIYKNN